MHCIGDILKKDTFHSIFIAFDNDSKTGVNQMLSNEFYANYIWYTINIDELTSMDIIPTYLSQQLFIIYALKSLNKIVEIQQFYNATEFNLHSIDNSLVMVNEFPDDENGNKQSYYSLSIQECADWLAEHFNLIHTAVVFYNEKNVQIFQYNFYRKTLRILFNENYDRSERYCVANMYEELYEWPIMNLYKHQLTVVVYFILSRTLVLKQRNKPIYGMAGIDVDIAYLMSQRMNAKFRYEVINFAKSKSFNMTDEVDTIIGRYTNISQKPINVDKISPTLDIAYQQNLEEFMYERGYIDFCSDICYLLFLIADTITITMTSNLKKSVGNRFTFQLVQLHCIRTPSKTLSLLFQINE